MGKRGESYKVAGAVLINGTPYPFSDFSVDVNAYSISSAISATLPLRGPSTSRKAAPIVDFGQIAQQVIPLPIEVRVGYIASPSPESPVPSIVLEKGFIDGSEVSYEAEASEIRFDGRGSASIFQDVRVGNPVNRNITGSQLVKSFFDKRGIPITVVDSPQNVYAGKTHDDALFTSTMRDRSEWDEMSAAALDDGYILTVHNGKGYYGPPALNAPTIPLDFGGPRGNVVACRVRHSPRRNHQLLVRVFSHLKKSSKSVGRQTRGFYGHTNAHDGATYTFFIAGLTQPQCKKKAQAIFYDLARREFVVEFDLVPDVAFLKTVAQYGANFSVALGGSKVMPSHKRVYGVRQVRFSMTNGERLKASVVASNLNPVVEGAELN